MFPSQLQPPIVPFDFHPTTHFLSSSLVLSTLCFLAYISPGNRLLESSLTLTLPREHLLESMAAARSRVQRKGDLRQRKPGGALNYKELRKLHEAAGRTFKQDEENTKKSKGTV